MELVAVSAWPPVVIGCAYDNNGSFVVLEVKGLRSLVQGNLRGNLGTPINDIKISILSRFVTGNPQVTKPNWFSFDESQVGSTDPTIFSAENGRSGQQARRPFSPSTSLLPPREKVAAGRMRGPLSFYFLLSPLCGGPPPALQAEKPRAETALHRGCGLHGTCLLTAARRTGSVWSWHGGS